MEDRGVTVLNTESGTIMRHLEEHHTQKTQSPAWQ